MRKILIPAVMVGAMWIFSCRKSITETSIIRPPDTTSVNSVPFPTIPQLQCTAGPDYGDSILFLQPTSGSQDWLVGPINNPGPGQYFAWPLGLSINASSGVIDISKSETGQRYMIGFVPSGSTDTCLHSLILGGSSYPDSIYLLTNVNAYSSPYFNANMSKPSPCAGGGCHFESIYPLSGRELKIDNNTGVIDLQQSFANGIFGLFPFDGETLTATIQYRLDDQSNQATQSTQVQFIYYYRQSDIPSSLLDKIENRRTNMYGDSLIEVNGSTKPPLIVITRATN